MPAFLNSPFAFAEPLLTRGLVLGAPGYCPELLAFLLAAELFSVF